MEENIRLTKSGKPDRRYKKVTIQEEPKSVTTPQTDNIENNKSDSASNVGSEGSVVSIDENELEEKMYLICEAFYNHRKELKQKAKEEQLKQKAEEESQPIQHHEKEQEQKQKKTKAAPKSSKSLQKTSDKIKSADPFAQFKKK